MKEKKRRTKFILVFFAALVVCNMITVAYVYNKSQMEHAQMEQQVLTRASKVSSVITKLLYKTQTLSALVIQNNGEVRDFERVAATILDDPAIRNVILAPDGIISHVYPLAGNEAVLGFDYFSQSEGNQEAIIARDSGQLVLGGPFNLVQGGQALVGRLPVYVQDETGKDAFWGLASVTLNYPQALDGAELAHLQEQGFAYEIWRISPDTNERQIIASSAYAYDRAAQYVEKPMTILNAEWYFRLSPIRSWYTYPETWIFTIAGFLISWLIASLVRHNADLKQMQEELEALTYSDALTGALNRRGIFRALERLMAQHGSQFVLCYLDLNKFKHVNDTYGHAFGDFMLRQFAEAVDSRLSQEHLCARIGGDEFVVILPGTTDSEAVKEELGRIRQNMIISMPGGKAGNIEVSFSLGCAAYPRDGCSVDELIARADEAMYREKHKSAQDNG